MVENRAARQNVGQAPGSEGKSTPDSELVGVTPLKSTAFAQAPTCQPTLPICAAIA
ncbi:Unknown protein sequence [Pseudomonas coronafaciens pv. oryzae]|nr:Unknown protein sequence [Pseudomonas coronafaciens pv. oryzae]